MILGTGWIRHGSQFRSQPERKNTQNEKKKPTYSFNIFDIIYKQKRYQDRLHVIFKGGGYWIQSPLILYCNYIIDIHGF